MSDAPAADPHDGLARAYARGFATADGARILAHLRAITAGRVLGPEASEAALRHLEGQRQLVAYIAALAERGREPPAPVTDPHP